MFKHLILFTSITTALLTSNADKNYKLMVDAGFSKSMNLRGTYGDNAKDSFVSGLSLYKKTNLNNLDIGISGSYRGDFDFNKNEEVAGDLTNEKQSFKISTALLNLKYNFNIRDLYMKPFINLGLGASKIKGSTLQTFDTSSESNPGGSKTNFTYAVRIGGEFKLHKDVNFALSYQYIDFGKYDKSLSFDEKQKGKLKANELLGSLVFNF